MDSLDNIQEMLKRSNDRKYISSMPMCMAKPLEGTKVRFWTKFSMENKDATTTIGNSLVGEYKNGCFVIDTDKWSDNEVFSWTKLTEEK